MLLLSTTSLAAGTLGGRYTDGSLNAGLHGGTLGLGINGGYDFSKNLAVRGLYNHFDWDYDKRYAGNRYDGKLKLQSFGVAFDWHPFSGAFRLSAGAFLNNNELSASARSDDLVIGNAPYSDANLDLRMDFDTLTPYLGIGWASGRGQPGLGITLDAGAFFQGSPAVSASGRAGGCDFSISRRGSADADCPGPGPVAGTLESVLESDLESEHRELADDLDDFKLYPVLSLGLSYRF